MKFDQKMATAVLGVNMGKRPRRTRLLSAIQYISGAGT
jgi:hypothetical protein